MKQKREILITICIADDPNNETDADILCKNLQSDLTEMFGEEKFLFIEHCGDEWRELV